MRVAIHPYPIRADLTTQRMIIDSRHFEPVAFGNPVFNLFDPDYSAVTLESLSFRMIVPSGNAHV